MGVCKGKRKLNTGFCDVLSYQREKDSIEGFSFDEARINIKSIKKMHKSTVQLLLQKWDWELYYGSPVLEMIDAFLNIVAFFPCMFLSE